jgi:hypothetical protein
MIDESGDTSQVDWWMGASRVWQFEGREAKRRKGGTGNGNGKGKGTGRGGKVGEERGANRI